MEGRPILIFDTSAINCLADDPDSAALIAGLKLGFFVRLTFTSASEIIATSSGERRRKLLGVCRRLLLSGDCVAPQHEIIRRMVARFEESPPFDWRKVYVGFPEAEQEIARQENFGDDLAEEERQDARTNNKVFVKVYDDAKPQFDTLFASGTEKAPSSVSELLTRLQNGGAFWTLAGNLYARAAKNPADEATIRTFVAQCEPFRALMIAFVAAQYDRCIRPPNAGPSFRSSRNDTFMAVYLPYCQQLVTNDSGQLECYREVVSIGGFDVAVRSYKEFRNSFFVAGAAAQ